MATDRIEATIREIAARHGIAVGRDDPILILQTLNELLLQDSVAAQQVQLDHFKEELEAIAHRWGEDARCRAERTLSAALTVSRETMRQGLQDAVNTATDSVRREIREVVAQLDVPIKEAKRVAGMNLVAAAMTILAAGLVLWAAH